MGKANPRSSGLDCWFYWDNREGLRGVNPDTKKGRQAGPR